MKFQLDGEQDDNNADIKEIVHDACGKRPSKFHLVINITERHKCVGDGCTDVRPHYDWNGVTQVESVSGNQTDNE